MSHPILIERLLTPSYRGFPISAARCMLAAGLRFQGAGGPIGGVQIGTGSNWPAALKVNTRTQRLPLRESVRRLYVPICQ